METPVALVLPMNSVLLSGVFMSQPIENILEGKKLDWAKVLELVNNRDRTSRIFSLLFMMMLFESVCG
jgi:hypothetical protein